MSSKAVAVAPTRSYHHGDLRGALVAAAERLMEEGAGWTFTLREVARAAGVSHNAPYNHFADRRALLAAVAARGFEDLGAVLRAGTAEAGASTADRIRMAGCAYVGFAVGNPSRYRLMFSAELAGCGDAAFRKAGEGAFGVLGGLVAKGVAEGALRADTSGTHALAAWSLVHGLATLLLDGKVPRPEGDEALASLVSVVAGTIVLGLRAA